MDKSGERRDNSSPVLVCSLTRTAAHEIAARDLPIPAWQVGTLHAHAYRKLGRPPIAETFVEDWNEQHDDNFELQKGAMKRNPDDMQTEAGMSSQDDSEGMRLYQKYNLLRQRMIDRELWDPEVLQFAKSWEEWKYSMDAIDFTDMIEIALRDVSTGPGSPDVLLVDEAQDLSRLELLLCNKWGKAAGALIFAGDPHQAIFVWRGADPYIFFDPSVPKDHFRQLSQSYRVPIKIRDLSMEIASELDDFKKFTYGARREDGEEVVGEINFSDAAYNHPEDVVEEAIAYVDSGDTVMFCATCGYMLHALIAVLKEEGVPFCNPRRPSRGDWNPLRSVRGVSTAQRLFDFLRIDHTHFGFDVKEPDRRWRLWTGEEFSRWASKLRAKGMLRRGAKSQLQKFGKTLQNTVVTPRQLSSVLTPEAMEQMAALIDPDSPIGSSALVDWYVESVESSFIDRLQYPAEIVARGGTSKLLSALEEQPSIFVGTVHSYKGFEADHVFVFPDLSPAGDDEYEDPATRDNVIRQFYVAVTRARKTITVCRRRGTMAFDLETPAQIVA